MVCFWEGWEIAGVEPLLPTGILSANEIDTIISLIMLYWQTNYNNNNNNGSDDNDDDNDANDDNNDMMTKMTTLMMIVY